ncbi:hypothetical protein CVS40_1334 [Lucilia cuprina]|nr:hypothetical protein CVS40_1334 [Lucilia cuprina]
MAMTHEGLPPPRAELRQYALNRKKTTKQFHFASMLYDCVFILIKMAVEVISTFTPIKYSTQFCISITFTHSVTQ